jgi:putative acetyltransferase
MITIRREREDDAADIRRVHEKAFKGSIEANVVEALRERGAVTLSLVAERDGKVVGHILFSPVDIREDSSTHPAVALGPMAVLPELQRTGIGSRLVKHGIEELRHGAHGLIVVLGHPTYYPRFGFVTASSYGIGCEFDVPDEAFMILELQKGTWKGRRGMVHYQPEFREA